MNYDLDKLIFEIKQRNLRVIAIDGFCGSGKTSVAQYLQNNLDCRVIPMDDFFPCDDRSRRIAEEHKVNLDFERLMREVPSVEGEINYKKFVCRTGEFLPVTLKKTGLTVIEGSYSHFPILPYKATKIYLDCPESVRIERLKRRPNFADFVSKWQPKEQTYQEFYDVRQNADIILKHFD